MFFVLLGLCWLVSRFCCVCVFIDVLMFGVGNFMLIVKVIGVIVGFIVVILFVLEKNGIISVFNVIFVKIDLVIFIFN